ncbi:stonustoxin subunit beta-like [Zootoca vivipara]|uniref:stonustoxin subunit beta-like n=1 Tax=Zootoca vivipara TaxID=8524 RepID=UPI001591D2B6|nr:stonustoxin subunit beta-like [Zootoca vivipara]XP_034986078.1 stonustoxin subunit beta-like [Zootoca vivipara]XP_060136476.1 stonustoxin subunit beta-like [Zootoca vivipara]
MAAAEEVMEMAALGRPFQLGMLYDCRRDNLIPGITLWDPGALKENIDARPQPNTATQVIESDTTSHKTHALDVSESLKASFLAGLVKVDGSAKFLLDARKSTCQARVTLQYSATTHFEQLTMRQIGPQHITYPEVFSKGPGTHVVVGILYGAHAFFVFDQISSSSESVRDIRAKLHVMVAKVPLVCQGKEEAELEGEEKAAAKKFSCTFHGDIALESNPTSYEEALKVYSSLPKLLGDQGEKAVPVKVWLYPLNRLESKAARLVRQVSSKLISDVEEALEQLGEVDRRCNDLLEEPTATAFPEIQNKTLKFQDLCRQCRRAFQKQVAGLLPAIRAGAVQEGALGDTLRKHQQSTFRSRWLHKFLDLKFREIYYVNFFLELSKGKVSSQDEVVKRVLDPKIDIVVAFTFTSLQAKEPYLEKLNAALDQVCEPKPETSAGDKSFAPWFEDKGLLKRVQKAAMVFSGYSLFSQPGEGRFVVTSQADESDPGAVIIRYQSGSLEGTKLDLLSKPLPPLADAVSWDRFQLTFKPAESEKGAISGYYVQHRVLGEEKWVFAHVKGSQAKFWVTGLEPETKYEFRYAVETKTGLSPFSDVSGVVDTTCRSSPPGKPALRPRGSCFSSQLQVTWGSPSFVADGIVIKEYKVQLRRRADGKWEEQRTGEKVESCWLPKCSLKKAAAVRVIAVYGDGFESEPSEELVQGEF